MTAARGVAGTLMVDLISLVETTRLDELPPYAAPRSNPPLKLDHTPRGGDSIRVAEACMRKHHRNRCLRNFPT